MSGAKYRCEIVLPEESPYRDYVKDLEWRPFDPLPAKNKKGNKKRPRRRIEANHHLLTEDESVMVGYFTGPNAFSAFKKVFGERVYAYFHEVFKEGLGLTRIYTLYKAERHLDKLAHKQLLRWCMRGGLSDARKREVGGVMRALDYEFMRVLDGNCDLVTFEREAVYMLNAWGYDVDEKRHVIQWPKDFTFPFQKRKELILRVSKRRDLPTDIKKDVLECIASLQREEQEKQETYNKTHPILDWESVFRTAKSHYEDIGLDIRRSRGMLELIRRQFGGRSTAAMDKTIGAHFAGRGITTYSVGDQQMDARSLVQSACDGNEDAMIALADLLAGVGTSRAVYQSTQDTSVTSADDKPSDIPAWALPEKAAIMQWADAAKDADRESPEGQIARYIRSQIGKGKLNVLFFDSNLYDEIVEADLAGGESTVIESFPFHIALIRLPDIDGVVGIAVFRWKDFIMSTNPVGKAPKAGHEGYGTAILTSGGGVDLNPDIELSCAAEKLVIYLDCDNAHIETVYVDGGTSHKQIEAVGQQSQDSASYVRGTDVVTGTQVVVEREHSKKERPETLITRRAHFRRGYYARRRIGKREDWHYERRWIKPTFVHGSTAVVTERKVRRLVL